MDPDFGFQRHQTAYLYIDLIGCGNSRLEEVGGQWKKGTITGCSRAKQSMA